ncbi:MAG: hypothetical protein EXR43_05935 [Dehalococcoidia bacterium]|nr:hypothetical protein [Dehalococcoidia bacterium]
MTNELDDLDHLARTYLGVVAAGLVPAHLASDERFRLDYVTAVCHALARNLPPGVDLDREGPQPQPAFLDALRSVIADLDARGVIVAGAGDGHLVVVPFLDPSLGRLTAGQMATLDLNRPPKIIDSYLAHRSLDALLALPAVYGFLMERYSASSEIWQRLVAQGYGR